MNHHSSHRHPEPTIRMARLLGWLSIGLGVLGVMYCARRLTPIGVNDPEKLADYRGRSGFPRPAEEMRGRATNGQAGPPVQAAPASGLP